MDWTDSEPSPTISGFLASRKPNSKNVGSDPNGWPGGEKIKHNTHCIQSVIVSRTALQSIAAVVVGILVVGVAAATITAPLDTSSPTIDPRNPQADGSGEFWDLELDGGDGLESGGSSNDNSLLKGNCIPFLLTPTFYMLAVLAFAGLFLVVRHLMATEIGVVAVLIVSPWAILAHGWFTNCTPPKIENPPFGRKYYATEETKQVARTIEAAGQNSPIPGEVVGGLLLIALVVLPVLAAFGIRRYGDSEDAPEAADAAAPDEPLSGVAKVAGQAADRIEGSVGDVDNEVFRAWKRMTEYVDVPEPKSSTPANFAQAARETGMNEEDVTLLTDLFRAIRYGGEVPTEERERRAIEALREIEATYSDGGDEE
ncbi:MAG: hypothetical protein ACI9EZ_001088 [Halobacteriales archaeon]